MNQQPETNYCGKSATGRINWIDGLRGIGCICIMLHHFFLFYYPATYYGAAEESRMLGGFDTKLADTPFFFLLNGNFWVCVYLMITGYVIANKRLDRITENRFVYYIKYFFKRYLTLLLPVLVSEIALLIITLVFPSSVVSNDNGPLTLLRCLKSSFIGVFFTMDNTVIGSLWSMVYIFLGGMLVLLLRLLTRDKIKILIPVYAVVMALCLLNCYLGYLIPVLCGGCFYIVFPLIHKYKSNIVSVAALIVGLFLAAYPTGMKPESIYRFLPYSGFSAYAFHTFAAILIFYAASMMTLLQKALSTETELWLGKISYPVYIFHGVFITLFNVLFLSIQSVISSYNLVSFIIFILVLIAVLIFSTLYERYADKPWRGFVSRLIV